ncbi:hypothetical protein BT96DRAFT_1020022 [Gymnopus androsaceus JB14]|uniref:DUF6534 domain-containing protein n=1 Tax=Gymnopus androsaceus JB14 TaxID=1447944 RepID=A0A6A4HLX8_9AGAR|nr:hypothetical protein BT96DRAFT_1020022 [Gymnopus androsaceus JB14]
MSDPSSVPPEVIAAAIAKVKEVFASSFIGFAVATSFYGISVLQCYLYYRNYPKDSVFLKLVVGFLWILDTLSTIMVADSLYTYFVLDFGNLAADALIPWSFALENGLLTFVTITAQLFYANQIWSISRNHAVTGVIVFLGLAGFGIGLYVTVHLFRFNTLVTLDDSQFLRFTGMVQGFAVTCDLAITGALIFYLYSRKRETTIRTTTGMLDTLMLYAVCRGILTAIAQIMFLALNVGLPDHTYWQPFHQIVGKLYVNSVVASLNVRQSVRGRGSNISTSLSGTSTSIGIANINQSDYSSAGSRAVPLVFVRSETVSDRRNRESIQDANSDKAKQEMMVPPV